MDDAPLDLGVVRRTLERRWACVLLLAALLVAQVVAVGIGVAFHQFDPNVWGTVSAASAVAVVLYWMFGTTRRIPGDGI